MGKMNKKGFTLAELLIVIAIMAVLMAIAIPVFGAQLEKSRHSVDDSTERSAKSLAEAHFLLEHGTNAHHIICEFKKDNEGNLVLSKCSAFKDATGTAIDADDQCDQQKNGEDGTDLAQCQCDDSKREDNESSATNTKLYVWVDADGVTATWAAATPSTLADFATR